MKNFLTKLKRYVKLPLIEQDKANHFIYGIIIYLVIKVPTSLILNSFFGIISGMTIGVVAAIGKEIYDKRHPDHTSDWKDAVWTIAGIVIGILLTIL